MRWNVLCEYLVGFPHSDPEEITNRAFNTNEALPSLFFKFLVLLEGAWHRHRSKRHLKLKLKRFKNHKPLLISRLKGG